MYMVDINVRNMCSAKQICVYHKKISANSQQARSFTLQMCPPNPDEV
jgi:hypothetical protein